MSDEAANLVLEHLRSIRAGMDQLTHDIHDVKFRLSQMEETMLHHGRRFDRLDERLARIESRLNLVEA